ncbi:MAG TPA: hypothetical protein VLB29_13550 [Nocardioidaceae bacterium]|nr:hypothetical protein [Nocardioidaceae bacterium]
MERHRCTKCRNPIRCVAVSRRGGEAWYHPDCWVEVRSFEQEGYEERVRTSGINALLAPYISGPQSVAGAHAHRTPEQHQV